MPHRHQTQTHVPTPPPRPLPPHVNVGALIIVFAVLATVIVLFMNGAIEPQLRKWLLSRKTN